LLDEAKREAEGIVRRAQLETNDAIKMEKERLAKRREEELAAYEHTVAKMMEERIAAARLDAKKEVQRVQDAVASEVISTLLEKLVELRKSKTGYKTVLASFYKSAAYELKESGIGGGLEIECAKEDVAIVKGIMAKGDSVKANANINGGIIVKSKKGGVMVDMTFATVVRDRESEVKARVYKKLFR